MVGSLLLTASEDLYVKAWDMENNKQVVDIVVVVVPLFRVFYCCCGCCCRYCCGIVTGNNLNVACYTAGSV